MTTKTEIYSEEYNKIVNQTLAEHAEYKKGMEIHFADLSYSMAFETKDMPITSEEILIFLDVLRQVENSYKLIHI